MTTQTTPSADILRKIADMAYPRSKNPHYGVEEAKNMLNAILALDGRVVFPSLLSEAEIREHTEWMQRHVR
jgi:hypothetical protein